MLYHITAHKTDRSPLGVTRFGFKQNWRIVAMGNGEEESDVTWRVEARKLE